MAVGDVGEDEKRNKGKEMKKSDLLFVSGLSAALVLTSCSDYITEDDPVEPAVEVVAELIDGEYVEWSLAPNGTARICCGMLDTLDVKDWEIRWYEVKDSVLTEIKGAINNFYDVVFEKTGIKELKCEFTYLDEVNDLVVVKNYPFHVAYTGLPALYITTENGKPIENKTDKIPATLELNGGADLVM